MTLNDYKLASQPDDESRKEEIINEAESGEEFDIYEYIMDNLYLMTTNLSDPKEEVQLETLQWFNDTFHRIYYVLPPDLIIQLFNFIYSTNELIQKEALQIIRWAISFKSDMQDLLLENGLLTFILTNFPDKDSTYFSYYLAALSESSREVLIQNGYIELLRTLREPETTPILSSLLHSLVNLPFTREDPDLFSEIFDTFNILWSNLHYKDREYSKMITSATHMLLKSNENFLCAFMEMEIFLHFIEVHEDLTEKDDPFLSNVFKLLTYIINQDEQFAVVLIEHNVVSLAEEIITYDYLEFPQSSIFALNFLTDLMFYRPEIIENVYDREIPHSVLDMFEDLNIGGQCLIDILSFTVVMMALASPKIFAMMKNIGCYTMIVENVNSIEDLYWKWTIRVIFRGFVVDKIDENEENRLFLSSNNDLIGWLEDIKKESNIYLSNSALELLVKIFPDYVDS